MTDTIHVVTAQAWRTVRAMWWVALLIACAFALFAWVPARYEVYTDPSLLLYVATTYTIAGLVMLAYTRDWNLIGRGMFVTIAGDALLYSRTSLPVIASESPFWRGQAWFMALVSFFGQHWISDVIRSCFAIGSTLFLIGVVLWIHRDRTHQRRVSPDPFERNE
jgi:hypothetical protein